MQPQKGSADNIDDVLAKPLDSAGDKDAGSLRKKLEFSQFFLLALLLVQERSFEAGAVQVFNGRDTSLVANECDPGATVRLRFRSVMTPLVLANFIAVMPGYAR